MQPVSTRLVRDSKVKVLNDFWSAIFNWFFFFLLLFFIYLKKGQIQNSLDFILLAKRMHKYPAGIGSKYLTIPCLENKIILIYFSWSKTFFLVPKASLLYQVFQLLYKLWCLTDDEGMCCISWEDQSNRSITLNPGSFIFLMNIWTV